MQANASQCKPMQANDCLVVGVASESCSLTDYLYIVSRLVTGVLLLFAGVSKLAPLRAVLLGSWLVLPIPVVFAWGVFELVIGWACLSLLPHRFLHRIVASMFVIFMFVLAAQWWSGEERCECMGSLSPPILGMFAVDIVLLLSLFAFSRSWRKPLRYKTGIFSEQVGNLCIVLPILLLAAIAIFGSLDATFGYLAGERVLVDAATKFAGEVGENEFTDVAYRLQNSSSQPIRVLGAKASCSCIAILDLPTTVEAGGTREIRLRLKGRTPNRVQRESAELLFDDSALRIVLNVTAIVLPKQK